MAKSDSGIYQITNVKNGKIYIGSSQSLKRRRDNHFSALRNGRHDNQHLQRSFDKYGEECFMFKILLECRPSELLSNEQKFIDKLNPEYNIAKFAHAGMRGRKHTVAARQAMSNKLKGRVLTEEHKRRISNAHKGKVQGPHSKEHRRKIKEASKGRKHTPESIEKLRKAHAGKKLSAEHRKNIGRGKSKAVCRICLKTGERKIYASMTEAKKEGFDQTNISRCCRNLQKQYRKYLWNYVSKEVK